MKGLIDIYKIKNLHNGLGQFSHNLYLNLIEKKKQDLEIDFLIPKHHPEVTLKSAPSVNHIAASFRRRYFPKLNPTYDFWHCTQQFPSFLPNKNTPLILTIHDLNFLVEKSGFKAKRYLRRLQKNVDRADYLTTISYFTKSEIEKHVDLKGKDIHVIHNGVFFADKNDGQKPSYIDGDKFFFSIGEFKVKKNFHLLLPLMKHFSDHQLIIAGNHDSAYGKSILEEINRLQLNNRVILPGKIAEQEKIWLYNHCRAFLFPSQAEGFGMPVIEAMQAGRPTFLSKYTSLPEIGGNKALYFNSFDPEDMAWFIETELKKFYSNTDMRTTELVTYSQKFNWEKCANEYLSFYEKVVEIQKQKSVQKLNKF
jgi:glycosyltransferase involved in cell wall biosynthesis